jgi:hypothetical protein
VRPTLAILALAAFAVRCAHSSAAPLSVPLTVEETAGVPRQAFPASASVPLPRGRLRSAAGLWLATSERRPVPMQAEILERWPDGSVRWLLVDFLADVAARGRATYTLAQGKPPAAAPGPRVRVTARAGTRVLDTGALRVTVPDDGAVLAREIVVGERRVGPVPLPALGVAGTGDGRAAGGRATVETEGPVRTELVLTARYPQGLASEARLAVFAGQPAIRLRHTLTNLANPLYMPIRSLVLRVPGTFSGGAVGVDGRPRRFAALESSHELAHRDAAPALLDGQPAGHHADGWARATGDDVAVTLVKEWFWQEYPKMLRVAADRVELDLLAGGTAPIQLGTGAAKTHEVWLVVEPADGAAPAADLAAALTAPLVAHLPAAWTVASRALPDALDPDAPGARDLLARLTMAVAGYQRRIRTERWDDGPPVACQVRAAENPRVGLYGDLNWGDWQFPGFRDSTRGCDGWGNLEYDLPQVLALAWAATGRREFLELLLPAARHYRDVDIIHHAPEHPDWVGLNHPHKPLHFSFEAEETVDLGHTWAEGLVSFYRLTGERRALAAARRLGDALVARLRHAKNPRQFGWPMVALAAVQDATGERRYLEGARAYADAALARYPPTPAAGDWKMGILADGLAHVHAATRDARLERWLLDYAQALLAEPSRYADPRYALPLGYLAATTGQPPYAAEARRVVRVLRIGEWGKPLAAKGRTGFRLLAPLAGLPAPEPAPERPAVRPGRASPPPASPPARRPRSRSRPAPGPRAAD